MSNQKIIQNSACCDYVTSPVPWREKNLTLPERNGPERCERASDSPPRRSAPFCSDSIEKSLGNHHKVVRIWKIIPTEAGLLWRSFRLPGDRWLFSFHAVVVNRDFNKRLLWSTLTTKRKGFSDSTLYTFVFVYLSLNSKLSQWRRFFCLFACLRILQSVFVGCTQFFVCFRKNERLQLTLPFV